MVEKNFNQFSKSARRGINKYTSLQSSKSMRAYGALYRKRTGKNPSNVNNKEDFFEFVDRNRLRRKPMKRRRTR